MSVFLSLCISSIDFKVSTVLSNLNCGFYFIALQDFDIITLYTYPNKIDYTCLTLGPKKNKN